MISKIKLEKFDTIPFEEGTSEMKNISKDGYDKMITPYNNIHIGLV